MDKFNFVFITVALVLSLFGCQGTTDPNIKEEVKRVSINSAEVFTYRTGISGDEEVATISEQPGNYEISTIVRDSTTGWEAVYQYKAESGFQGTDHVELKLGMNSDGANPAKDIKIIKLAITVNRP